MNTFDFEQLYIYWSLKDLIQLRPWVDKNCEDGSIMKMGLFNKATKQQMTIVYKKFYNGLYELKHIRTNESTTVQQCANGELKYHIEEETYYDDEAQEYLDAI